MNNTIKIILLFATIILAGCTDKIEVTDFDSCANAGYPVMESYPRQCRANDITYVEDISDQVFECTDEQRNVDACIEIYQPVCGKVNIQCVTTPCNPINQTFSNSCYACKNELVESYTIGECA